MNWRYGRPRRIGAYTDLGPIRIPPRGPHLILTDRGDGTLWHLSFTTTPPSTDGDGYITLNSTIPSDPYKIIYGPYDGPWVNEDIQLFVRDGYLGMDNPDQRDWYTDHDQARIMARSGLLTEGREIIIPAGFSLFHTNELSLDDVSELAWIVVEY